MMYRHWKLKTCYLDLLFMSILYLTTEKESKFETIVSVRRDLKDRKVLPFILK